MSDMVTFKLVLQDLDFNLPIMEEESIQLQITTDKKIANFFPPTNKNGESVIS